MNSLKVRVWDNFHNRMIDDLHFGKLVSLNKALQDNEDFKIMLWIGLKDKNGKEIYIDDLIDLGYCFGKVVFNESDFGAPCYCIEDIEGGFQPFFEKDDYTKIWFEVIGNIYENPELLN